MRFQSASVIGLLLLAGCATHPTREPAPTKPAETTAQDQRFGLRNQGYSLLYKLLADEQNVSKLLLIKKEEADTGALLREISEVAGAAVKQLEQFSKADPHLHLDMPGLPSAENEARETISKLEAKELITKGGEKFELRVLLTQVSAVRYGAALAYSIHQHETDPTRQKFLATIIQNLEAQHQKLIDLMHTRWQMPAPKK